MRNFLRLLALIMALMMLCSCSVVNGAITSIIESTREASAEESAEPSEEVSEEPSEEQDENMVSYVESSNHQFGVAFDPDGSFNPITSQNRLNQDIIYLIYEGLFEVTPEYTAEPVLCTSYEVSDNQLVYTFSIRTGVTFHNGQRMTSEDVVYSLNMASNTEASVYSSRFHSVATIEALDEYTVQIVLGSPYEQLPLILDIPIIPTGSIDTPVPSGTGPYKLSGSGDSLTLLKNNEWRNSSQLPFDQIYLYDAESSDTLRDDFETSRIDLLKIDPTGTSSITFHNDYELFQYSTNIFQYVGFNYDSDVFSNEYARRAVCYCIDRETIVDEIYNGRASAAVLPCREESILYDEALAEKHGYNTAKVRELYEEGSFTSLDDTGLMYFETSLFMQPLTVDFIVNSENTYKVASAERIAEVMNENGFSVNLRLLTYDDYMKALSTDDYDMYLAEVKLTADFDLTTILTYYGKLNFGTVTYEDLSLYIKGALENSGAALDLFILIYEHGLMAPVLFKDHAVIAPRGLITNISPTAANSFYGITDWIINFE